MTSQIDFKKRQQEIQDLRASSQIILRLQQDVVDVCKDYDEKLTPEIVGTAMLHVAARISCQLNMNSKQFSAAAKEAFKAVAKELRG